MDQGRPHWDIGTGVVYRAPVRERAVSCRRMSGDRGSNQKLARIDGVESPADFDSAPRVVVHTGHVAFSLFRREESNHT